MTKKSFTPVLTSSFLVLLFWCQNSFAFEFNFFKPKRNYIYVVGSSTVSPFIAAVAEEFQRSHGLQNPDLQTAVVESDGSTGGFRRFCSGVGLEFPDFVNASRIIRENELEDCNSNQVRGIVEIKIGYDGIVLANSLKSEKIKLTKEQIFLALADKVHDKKTNQIIKNPYQNWSDISPNLPKKKILFFGPPLSSGTRDVFADIVMEDICFMNREFIQVFPDRDVRRRQCHKIRDDKKFITIGENDNLTVAKLQENPDAIGIFGFNFLVANKTKVQPVAIDGIEPSYSSIASKKYELSRPLFVYFKKEHLKLMPQISDFVKEIIDDETIGQKGYLTAAGLIAMQKQDLREVQKSTLSQLQ